MKAEKKMYERPLMRIFEVHRRTQLLTASQKGGQQNYVYEEQKDW